MLIGVSDNFDFASQQCLQASAFDGLQQATLYKEYNTRALLVAITLALPHNEKQIYHVCVWDGGGGDVCVWDGGGCHIVGRPIQHTLESFKVKERASAQNAVHATPGSLQKQNQQQELLHNAA